MNQKSLAEFANSPTRRHLMAGAAAALGTLAAVPVVWGKSGQATTKAPSTAANKTRTSLHQEVDFKASAQRIYETLLDSKLFMAFSGEPAEISHEAGGTFSMFGARIVGRNIELVPNTRIVQAWRPGHWDPGVYSVAKFELKEQGAQTRVVLDHTGFPEGDFESLSSGWKAHYWDRLTKYFG